MALPFSVKEVNIYKEIPGEVWSYVRRTPGESKRDAKVRSVDIDLVNSDGEVILSFKELVALPARPEGEPIDGFKSQEKEEDPALHLYTSKWDRDSNPSSKKTHRRNT